MKQIAKVLTAIILCIAVFFVLLSGLETKESSGSTAMVGETVPAFKLSDVTDASTYLTESIFHNDSLTLLNVWAAWCGICKTEHQF
ncbi:hypothetical protein [Aliivibrio fischeri]|nr:hypothetical protein [Aliivibrio fischeri]MCE7553548.1 hypothetical protein [Aliivibrio fischeri]MCE7561600.1 hypothetical protein [Aliivibrio fischeri]MCE7569008.1 hypothetical protein [Aliivibrio fischeri]